MSVWALKDTLVRLAKLLSPKLEEFLYQTTQWPEEWIGKLKILRINLWPRNSCCAGLRLTHQRHVQTMLSYTNLGKIFYRGTLKTTGHQSNKRTVFASQNFHVSM